MTQRRRIAIAYSFAVPVLLAVVLLQGGALFRLTARDSLMDRMVSELSACDQMLSSLKDVETQAGRFIATGSDEYLKEYSEAASQSEIARKQVEQFAEQDLAMPSKWRPLADLTGQRLGLIQRSVNIRETKRSGLQNPAWEAQESSLAVEIGQIAGEIRHDEQAQLQQQKARAASSARTLDALIKYGGALTIWIVAVAAFLLFYDENERFRSGMEQQLQTEILESLPLGVCLATESDVILYANPAAEDAFGYQEGELVARNVSALHETDELATQGKVGEIFAQLVPREMWSGELPIRKKDGEILRSASWVTNVKVGHKNCRLLIHTVPGHWNREGENRERGDFSSKVAVAEGTRVQPPAADADEAGPSKPRGPAVVGASSRSE